MEMGFVFVSVQICVFKPKSHMRRQSVYKTGLRMMTDIKRKMELGKQGRNGKNPKGEHLLRC